MTHWKEKKIEMREIVHEQTMINHEESSNCILNVWANEIKA